jgi:hypothetical protein
MITQNALLKLTDYDMKLATFAIQFSVEASLISPEVQELANELLAFSTKFGMQSQKCRQEGFKVEKNNAAS